jgi:transposase
MDAVRCEGCVRLSQRVAELERELQKRDRQDAVKNARIRRLQEALLKFQRASKRQAAPFSKGEPKKDPEKPGRKSGRNYGPKAHREPPPPEKIDEILEAPLPDVCPDCGGPLEECQVAPQYQVDIVRRSICRQFNVHIGVCGRCERAVHGRHPLQTSDALGAAGSQLGPDAQAAVVELQKNMGLSHAKAARCLGTFFGISLTPGGATQIILRAAQRCQPVYEMIREAVRIGPWAVPDETGWRIGGLRAWLHAIAGPWATAYLIDRSRGADVSEKILGRDYSGILIHDGAPSYNASFDQAKHQQCLQHLINRCTRILKTATGGAVRFPRTIQDLLRTAIHSHNRFLRGEIGPRMLSHIRAELSEDLWDAVMPPKSNEINACLARYLENHLGELLTFLSYPWVDGTNYVAEHAIRGGVILRKVWGGNRTDDGKVAQCILMSIWRTCWQYGISAMDWLSAALRFYPALLPLPP